MYYFPPHLKYVDALPLGIFKLKFVVKLQNKIKTRIYLSKKESFIHVAEWILLLLQKLFKVSNTCTHTCAKTSTPLVNCVVNDALVHCCSQAWSKRCYNFL